MSTVPFDATGAVLKGGASSRSIGVARLPAQARLALPKVLLCDLDGTLIDSMPTLADLATEVMAERYGTPQVLARELYLATCGLPFIKQLEEIFPDDARNPGRVGRFEARKPARCGAIRMARRPAARSSGARPGHPRRGVVEQRRGERRAFARDAEFTFDLVLGYGDGLAKGKPHLDTTSRVFGPRRQEMLFVGDSLHDGEIAEREGVPFVGIATTFSPDRFALRFPCVPVIRRFSALPDALPVGDGGRAGRAAGGGPRQPPGVAHRAFPKALVPSPGSRCWPTRSRSRGRPGAARSGRGRVSASSWWRRRWRPGVAVTWSEPRLS